jgi:hypothetical protein
VGVTPEVLPNLYGQTQQESSGPSHKRAEGLAPVRGFELTTKAATLQIDSSEFVPAFVYVGLGPVAASARVLIHKKLDRGARPLFAAALVVRRRYLIVVPRSIPAAPRRYLIVVPRPLPAAA